MKRKIFGLCAIALAVVFSSFTYKPTVAVYAVYDQANPEPSMSSYSFTQTNPGVISGTDILAWFRIDSQTGEVTLSEFNAAFAALDLNANSSLDDESEITGVLEKAAE